MENNEPLDEVLADLKKKGYEADMNFGTETFALYASDLDMRLDPDEFHVDEIDEACDESHSDAEVVVYAISTATGVKGVEVEETSSRKD